MRDANSHAFYPRRKETVEKPTNNVCDLFTVPSREGQSTVTFQGRVSTLLFQYCIACVSILRQVEKAR